MVRLCILGKIKSLVAFSASFRPTKEFVVSEEEFFVLHEKLDHVHIVQYLGLDTEQHGSLGIYEIYQC